MASLIWNNAPSALKPAKRRNNPHRMLKKSVSVVLARHCRLTVSAASANVTLIILRVADLAAALLNSLFEHPVFVTSLLAPPLGRTIRQSVFFFRRFCLMPTITDTWACRDSAWSIVLSPLVVRMTNPLWASMRCRRWAAPALA